MPYLVHHHREHHRRRHSWPYCGGGTQPQSLGRNWVVFQSAHQQQQQLQYQYQQQQQKSYQQLLKQHFLVPVGSEDLLEDDAASAGIGPSLTRTRAMPAVAPNNRSRRWWSSWWSSSARGGSSPQDDHTSPSGHGGPFRKMVRPPLDKAKSLFVMPTTTTQYPVGDGEEVLFTSYLVPSPPSSPRAGKLDAAGQVDATSGGLLSVPVVDVAGGRGGTGGGRRGRAMDLLSERNHRRCHSEQPRSWKRPSASLWPLEEE
ncbi:uncharacterized protein BO66DRAFT_436266 [Aspergillus aculeatinus CBS 121060]|uniref:Uncharacterized protein n=1 Tax=Aspergillus aculeatinus CBS 121060 TaxID=1448322 RepID=A0ACD1HGN4_9EURO|nr:hypothetical protein BO66DRAFT_436266 [Aspergillus aculeatinus CBS 121060]RAH72600.1 hypothetical protein BO66DRAFT_436266 [Aspergillus aculeatinus CBS 121060]